MTLSILWISLMFTWEVDTTAWSPLHLQSSTSLLTPRRVLQTNIDSVLLWSVIFHSTSWLHQHLFSARPQVVATGLQTGLQHGRWWASWWSSIISTLIRLQPSQSLLRPLLLVLSWRDFPGQHSPWTWQRPAGSLKWSSGTVTSGRPPRLQTTNYSSS